LLAARWCIQVGRYQHVRAHEIQIRELRLRSHPESVVFMFVDNTFAAIFNAIDRQKLYAYVALSGLAINFTLYRS
jgi:hypothetical protein